MIEHPELPLLKLETDKLLNKFGEGSHSPGSGSAAALMGILAGKLILTVCKMTLARETPKKNRRKIEFVVEQITQTIEPILTESFQKDSETFDRVIDCRRRRDKAPLLLEKKRIRKDELFHLRTATEIPIKIGRCCLSLVDHGIFVFDHGFQPARGDSGAAISCAIAGASSAAFVIGLNLKSFKQLSKWKLEANSRCENLITQLQKKQAVAFGKITQLHEEEIKSMEFDL
jgi:formiminotetrahydrofolate cyclodeaminase